MTTNIEWVRNIDGTQGYTINPVKGLCPVACSYCYARRMYKRFKWNPRLRYDPAAWLGVGSLRKPSRILVGSTMELFHDSLTPQYLKWIFEVPLEFPQHTFIFLTKYPQNLINWSPFPENCWVGVTTTNREMFDTAIAHLIRVKARVKYISFEPLLDWRNFFFAGRFEQALTTGVINWLIIGQQTPASAKTEPKIGWIREIVEAADRAGIPVFLKNNLRPLLIPEDCSKPNYLMEDIFWASEKAKLRQELPGRNGE